MFFTVCFKTEPLRRDPVTIFSYAIESFIYLLTTVPTLLAGYSCGCVLDVLTDDAVTLGIIDTDCM